MNPELRRNLWLEFSAHRLIAMPAIILLVGMFIYAISKEDALRNLAVTAVWGAVALLPLWGAKLAMGSVTEEARDRTWDAQRLSSIGPWQMTWGKLLGATAFVWYGGVICILLFVFAGVGKLQISVLKTASIIVIGSILLHSVMLNAGLFAVQKGQSARSSGGLIILFLLLIIGPSIGLAIEKTNFIVWWGMNYVASDFMLASIVAYAVWTVFGAYRSMCSELQVRTTPWALAAFLCFTSAYLAGFAPYPNKFISGAPAALMASGLMVSLSAGYLLLFFERTGAMTVLRLKVRVERQQWMRVLEELPGWPVALALAVPFSVGSALLIEREFMLAPFVLVLFAVRDAALMHFFAFSRKPKRVEMVTLVYLALLYWLIPALLYAMDVKLLGQLVMPPLSENMGFSLVVMLGQAGLAVILAAWRWRRNHGAAATLNTA